jgi:hypothetical protein
LINLRIFKINICNFFSSAAKISIKKVIGFSWVWIWKGKLCDNTLKVYQVWNKPNLDNIFKSYLSYRDLKSLRNPPNCLKRLQKTLFVMIQQLGPPMFFITFTFAKRLWDHFIKVLHTLHVSKSNLLNKSKTSNLFI